MGRSDQLMEDFKYQVTKFKLPTFYTRRGLLRVFEQFCDKNQCCFCKKKFLKINLARVHADKSEVRGTTDKAVVIPRAVNAGVECFSGSWIDDKRRIEVRAVLE